MIMKYIVRTSDGKAMYPAPDTQLQSSYHRSFGYYWCFCEVGKEVVVWLHITQTQSQLGKVASLVPKSLRGVVGLERSGGSATADRLALDALDALNALLISNIWISNTVRFQSCRLTYFLTFSVSTPFRARSK